MRRRLVILFFAITAIAVGIVYLYVVPQLESNLVAEKLDRLERAAGDQEAGLRTAMTAGRSQAELRALVGRLSRRAGARLTLLGVAQREGEPAPAFVVADSESEAEATAPSYAVAAQAVRGGQRASGIEAVDGQRVGQTAVPLAEPGRPGWVAVFSVPLTDIADNVGLIRRQILIAGAIALAVALLAGWYAAQAIARRLRRLEQAARQVAGGSFAAIPVDSTDELGQLAAAFNEMQQRLARLDEARKEFIANASHELRTPIFSLGGFVELLEDEGMDPATRQDFLATMREQVERLRKLTTDLLDLSRIDAGALEVRPAPVDVAALARAISDEFAAAAAKHGSKIELRTSGGRAPVALADPDRLAQIVRILLDNALTHTPEGTPITVTALSQNDIAELVVSDEGPGIHRRSQGRVFERFYTGSAVKGSGLGLALARELAQRMGGRIDLASGSGFTAFTLELPLAGDSAEVEA